MQTARAVPLTDLRTSRPPAADCFIEPVTTGADRDRFIRFQIDLYHGDPNFIPPIIAERRDFLDAQKNSFLHHAQMELFLALRQGKVIGRIAAINDVNFNQFHNAELGFFGLFECVNEPGVAGALFDAASNWVKARGLKEIVGPVNISMSQECGLLVEGFDEPPAMMMPYNPRHYVELYEASGLTKYKDLWSYEVSASMEPSEKVVRVAEKLRARGVKVRPINIRDVQNDARSLKLIYDSMLERTFGFVPMDEEEFEQTVARLKPLVQVRPELCLIAEADGEPVAFSLTVADANVALRAAGGYLTRFGLPIGLAKLAWSARKIDRVRALMFAVKPSFRRRGIEALFCVETLKAAREFGFVGGELGWIHEDNNAINRAVEAMGARRHKTYRLYHRAV